ncbi:uncharacterized protein [Nicotiana sylvestris]|uniref:uncharacterized protein n=1 Tax=Nicotiana sylvestris TaxID=4096 RepID=UPI00388C9C9E
MDKVDKSWMHLLRWTDEYIRGVNDFLDKAFERASQGNEILCPCQKCINHNWHYRNVVEDHLVVNDFVDGYTEWVFHSEGFSSRITPHQSNNDEGSNMHDDIDGLLHDTFRNIEAFSDLLELLKEAFPLAKLPESFNKVKNMIKDLGLHYEKIHACPNDCMLFWNDNAKTDNCSICGSSRWKSSNHALTNTSSKVPAKVLRHPADGEAWKDFDSLHPDFSKDPHNVRLGLSSDGFNPFRTMSISHSTWLVMLMNYNLSPWICMKPEYIMLSMIIPGPSSPGNDIDVYLQPLIAELKELWETGIETYDAKTKQTFQMRAALLWIINDFPALAMLSGWSTKGRLECPTCNYDTCSLYLKHSHKMCYMGHRRFLPHDHHLRKDKKSFDGKEEHRPAPTPLSGVEVFQELLEFNNIFGKGKKKRPRDNKGPWKKRSIFLNCHIGRITN